MIRETEIGEIIFTFSLEDAIRKGILCEFDYIPLPYILTEEEKAKAAKAKSNIDQLISMLEQGGIDKDMVPELDILINVLNKKKLGNE